MTIVETRVNTYADGNQSGPAIATLSDGGYVVTWHSFDQDGSDLGIYVQRYDATGAAIGNETQVNTYTSESQQFSQVAALSGGGWIVTWISLDQDGSGYGVYMQRYDATGTAVGSETQVNTYTSGYQIEPHVAALSDGGWIVTWTSAGQDGSGNGIFSQRYDASGAAEGGETQVNTFTTNPQTTPIVTALADGGYIVVWQSLIGGSNQYDIRLQRFNAAGAMVGGETQVNTHTLDNQTQAAVTALADGGYVVVWSSSGGQFPPQDGSSAGVYAQRYDATGAAVGGETLINTYTASAQNAPAVTALSDGSYVIVWQSLDQDGSSWGVYGQQFGADGVPIGTEFLVNATITDVQGEPAVSALADGGFVVTWRSGSFGPPGSSDVYSRTFTSAAEPVVMTAAVELVTGTNADETILAQAGALGADDGVDGLGGFDTIALTAAGMLDISAPTSFAHIEALVGSSGEDTFGVDAARLSGIAVIDGGGGQDTIRLMSGLSLDLSGVTLTSIEGIEATDGHDTLTLTAPQLAGMTSLSGGAGIDTLQLAVAGTINLSGISLSGVEDFYGSSGADTIVMAPGTESIFQRIDGRGGSDTITGNAGKNVIDGGSEADQLSGLGGDDVYFVDNIADLVLESTGAGIDIVRASVDYMLPAGQEVEALYTGDDAGTAPITLTGNEVANKLTGNDGDNILNGGGGDDILTGNGGADALSGDQGNDFYRIVDADDLIFESAGQGIDIVRASASYTLQAGKEVEALYTSDDDGTAVITLTGNEFANKLRGNNGSNVLNGAAGADKLTGRAGADDFAFSTALGPNNIDRIMDFLPIDDTVVLSQVVFTALPTGSLAATTFKDLADPGAVVDADDRILYDHNTGALSYDLDGSGATAATQFAIIVGGPIVNAADFFIV